METIKLVLIGNCQTGPLNTALSNYPEFEMLDTLDVNTFGSQSYNQKVENLKKVLADPPEGLVVLTQKLSDKFPDIATEHLRRAYPRTLVYTNISFAGFHPDIFWVGGFQNKLSGPMGVYHSRIVASSFLAGLGEAECREMFNGEVYEKLGFYDVYASSRKELLVRDEVCDIKFAERFFELSKQRIPLYCNNHPTSHVVQELTSGIAEALSVSPRRLSADLAPCSLSVGAWWPIYDEVSERHGLAYRDSGTFKQPRISGGKLLTLDEVITEFYSFYRSLGQDEIGKINPATDMSVFEKVRSGGALAGRGTPVQEDFHFAAQ
ncbi:hypothetical protein E0493_16245 [Roseomonas sp. M0104]|uniref:Polysaccharide biosynthesis enzyme WcbI domain-containing protein n=1 Tax=Teichococcus coralli TaxID=2545983 RepID=A0A845BBD0_9PROT|nr:WcbI family polysaccharide biosynthesis putative acetyltransferase [Pseudoroseomonas coralli]MXP64903.1 hypothetical protein [Pseudoroseomonas coralli]